MPLLTCRKQAHYVVFIVFREYLLIYWISVYHAIHFWDNFLRRKKKLHVGKHLKHQLECEFPQKVHSPFSWHDTFLSLSLLSLVLPKNMSTQRKLNSYLNWRSKHFPKWQYSPPLHLSHKHFSTCQLTPYLVKILVSSILFICSGSCIFFFFTTSIIYFITWTPAELNLSCQQKILKLCNLQFSPWQALG